MTEQEQSLFERALEIRDQQLRGIPLTWIKPWPAWLADLHAYEIDGESEKADALYAVQPVLFP